MQPVMIFAVPKTDTRTNASSFKAERSAHLSLSVSSVYSYQILQNECLYKFISLFSKVRKRKEKQNQLIKCRIKTFRR